MSKIKSLIRACMSDNMSLFRVKKKDKTKTNSKYIAIALYALFMFFIFGYACTFLEVLSPIHQENVLLTVFSFITAMLIIIEGIYKSGSLLFNCKDDDMLLSLPIKKSTVVFIRIFKFYVFELLYSSMFLIPTMIAYAIHTYPGVHFYLVSIIAIILLPIVPIVISCVVGAITSAISAKFKKRNIMQIIVSMVILLGVLYASFNSQMLLNNFGNNASPIGETIERIYYPSAAYTKLVTSFNIADLLIFIGVHIVATFITIFVISKVYFKINSSLKMISKGSKKKTYKFKTHKPLVALISKELKKFINTPVLVVNAIFGLVIFVVACVILSIKFDSIMDNEIIRQLPVSTEIIKSYVPVMLFGILVFGSLTSSITSSMISLEGKFFSTLKSLPVKPYTIIMSKVYTAVLVMLPFIIVGDLVFFIKFQFNFIQILLISVASIVIPFVAELMGILINLRFPELKADSDAEVVKQSSSSSVSVLLGLILVIITISVLAVIIVLGGNAYVCLSVADALYILVFVILLQRLKTSGVKKFNNIEV
ncbi:MAG: hypothetical protein IKE01_07090 [Clostridia bacterium]|nr:hypothetical protein [Clostridia bacterium]